MIRLPAQDGDDPGQLEKKLSEPEIDPKLLKALMDSFESSDWDELTLTLASGDSLHLSRDPDSPDPLAPPPPPVPPPAAPAAVTPAASAEPAPAEPAPAEPAPSTSSPASTDFPGVPVSSTTVGIFWVAPAPGAPPFVEVGDRVAAGDTIGIVEVMKLMNHVPAGVDGVISAILVGNGEPVEYGQALVVIDPEG